MDNACQCFPLDDKGKGATREESSAGMGAPFGESMQVGSRDRRTQLQTSHLGHRWMNYKIQDGPHTQGWMNEGFMKTC